MQLETGSVYYGFKLLNETEISEIKSTARIFAHVKSGARIFNLNNDDDNKVFSISFRTPPEDSTGLPHILEHSVLCGSRKFPTKEPFVELVKGSLNTFLNAMTFSDKTMYPVASKNEKDFYNLMDVYMDAVFYPKIYECPEIFMQEGWHYDLDEKDGEITYKGVVYNEMKGAFSSPESILFRKIQESLYPDTPYGKESGGDPDVLPELTLEEFTDFHKKYYHPSNSYIYLYGNGDILEQLKFINDKYLDDFDRLEIDSKIPVQKPFEGMKEMFIEYPISPDEEENDKTYFSLNFAAGKSIDPESYLALQILEYLLLETPAAPLKKALIKEGLGKDVFGQYDNSIQQPVFSIVVKNTNEDKKKAFKELVFETLKKLVKEGIDKKLIEASINKFEFELRETDGHGMPKGLIYGIKCMDSWLYDEDPSLHLRYEPVLEKIKTALTTDYFERLIEKYILDNSHCSLLILNPARGLAEKRAREIKEELKQFKSGLSEDRIKELIEQTEKLRARQAAPDTPEALETIPLLELTDISKEAARLDINEDNFKDTRILHHDVFTNKIAYFNILFDTSGVPQEMLPYVGLLSDVLGKISTAAYDYSELSNEVNINTGGIGFFVEAYIQNGNYEKYYPKFIVKSKALVEKLPRLCELIGETIKSSKFDDDKRIKEVIQETRSQLEMKIFERGHLVAARRLNSYFSPAGYYMEVVSGLTYYKFIVELEKNFDSKFAEISSSLKKVSDIVFNNHNLILSITCDKGDYDKFKKDTEIVLEKLGSNRLSSQEYSFELFPRNEGLMTPGKVQYVAKGYNFIKSGYPYKGSLQVLRTIAGYDYLWNHVRVRGGAYGAFNKYEWSGNMCFVSYRDPNLRETLNIYDETVDFLNNFHVDDREMTKYIIGTISRLDAPLTPSMEGEIAVENYIRGITHEDIQREREEVLNTGQDDIKSLAGMISNMMEQNYYCILGSEEKIKENKDIFSNLVNVFE